jgi:hypothetical protein
MLFAYKDKKKIHFERENISNQLKLLNFYLECNDLNHQRHTNWPRPLPGAIFIPPASAGSR